MRKKDWSLVFFTTLAQLSVGIILWFTFAGYFYNDMGLLIETGLSTRNPVLLALVFVGVATVVSFLHLGKPANAPNALNNLSGSWLSREILALGIYAVSLIIVLALGWNTGNTEKLKYLLAPSSVLGLALLWMMIRIYVIPTIPAWHSWYTPLSFISTAICLGLLVYLTFQYAGTASNDWRLIKKLLFFLMLVLFTESISGFFHQSQLEKLNTGIDELVFDQGVFYKTFLLRMGLLTIAFLVVFMVVLDPGLLSGEDYFFWLYPLMVLIIVEEILGRLLFYSTYFRIGV